MVIRHHLCNQGVVWGAFSLCGECVDICFLSDLSILLKNLGISVWLVLVLKLWTGLGKDQSQDTFTWFVMLLLSTTTDESNKDTELQSLLLIFIVAL